MNNLIQHNIAEVMKILESKMQRQLENPELQQQ